MKRSNVRSLCATLILGALGLAQMAQADGLTGFYVGASFGRARNDYDTGFVDNQLKAVAEGAGDTLTFTSSSVDRSANAWWADAGYMPWAYVGIDASFIHLGELTHRAAGTLGTAAGNFPFITTTAVTSSGPALALLVRLPLAESWDINVRVGDYFGKTTLTTGFDVNSVYTVSPQSARKSSLLAGVGGAYTFAGHWSVRLDYLRIDRAGDSSTVGKFNANLATAGVTFTF